MLQNLPIFIGIATLLPLILVMKDQQMIKKFYLLFLFISYVLFTSQSFSQTNDSGKIYGVWQNRGGIIDKFSHPVLQGRVFNYKWKDLEVSEGVWDWASFDAYVFDRLKDSLPLILRVFTQENAPDWLFELGVPKVMEKDENGNETGGYAPYYLDSTYKYYFKRRITAVRQHIESYPYSIRKYIVGVQPCFGEEGDYIGYKGQVDPKYRLSNKQRNDLFQEFSLYFYNEYKNTNPRIRLFSNPSNKGREQTEWLLKNCPNGWLKFTVLGKAFQVNDEVDKTTWLLKVLNQRQNGEFVRAGTELSENNLDAGWWKKNTPRNMFALMSYMIYWGMDWSQQIPETITSSVYDDAFTFFNKYAGQKDTAASEYAMCAFRDGLDAADINRFPESAFGTAVITNKLRYQNIANSFADHGAKLEDIVAASGTESDNLYAKGINDIGWRILPGNYERYLHQLNANSTSTGYWNVDAPNDSNAIYGKYARGIGTATGKDALYFTIDKSFLSPKQIKANFPISIDITYLDAGNGSFGVYYDSKGKETNKEAIIINCQNTGKWTKASVVINDAYFGDRSANNSDFYIKSFSQNDIIFSVVELAKPGQTLSKSGFSATSPAPFDTICYTAMSDIHSFTLTGSFLDGSPVKVGPVAGFQFASTSVDSALQDSLIINSYGSGFQQTVYVRFKPSAAGNYNIIPVTGGGTTKFDVPVSAVALNSSPDVSANVSDITCYNSKNGAIDLVLENGAGPFSYQWSSSEKTFKLQTEDITDLIPADYTVAITSKAGCVTTKTFSVKQPEVLAATAKTDSAILCKGGLTTVTVSATGGNLPYQGTGTFTISSGHTSFPIVDNKGCTTNANITVDNGKKMPPSKPSFIEGAYADAAGVCANNTYTFTASKVSDASSYAWAAPQNAEITSIQNNGQQITLKASPGFNSGSLSVSAVNACGVSNSVSKNINIAPAKPSSINGASKVSQQQKGVEYKVESAVNGLKYMWEVTGDGLITSGQSTSEITVTWGNSGGRVKVYAQNDCSSSADYILEVTTTGNGNGKNLVSGNVTVTDDNMQNMVAQKTGTDSNFAIQLSPNPASTYTYLRLNGNGEYSIELSDMNGKVLLRKTTGFISKTTQQYIDVKNYAAGIYLVRVTSKNGYKKTIKLLKAN